MSDSNKAVGGQLYERLNAGDLTVVSTMSFRMTLSSTKSFRAWSRTSQACERWSRGSTHPSRTPGSRSTTSSVKATRCACVVG
jgi:hypothetical protein